MTINDEDADRVTRVEVTLPDGTSALWVRELSEAEQDELTDLVERMIGGADSVGP